MYMNLFLVILFLSIFYVNTHKYENEADFVDIAVRLIGNNKDSLIADLIAAEKGIIHMGHVSDSIIFFFLKIEKIFVHFFFLCIK